MLTIRLIIDADLCNAGRQVGEKIVCSHEVPCPAQTDKAVAQ